MDGIKTTAPWKTKLPKAGFTEDYLQKETARRDGPRREVGDRRSGLRVRIEPSGTATWIYYERMPVPNGAKPKRKKHTLGSWPAVTIESAREKVKVIKRAKGGSAALAELHPTAPFRTLVERFIEGPLAERTQEKEARARGLKGPAERVIRRLVIPYLGERPIALIQPREISVLIESIAKGTLVEPGAKRTGAKPKQAGNVFGLVTHMFNYARGIGIEVANPCQPLDEAKLGAEEGEERERCLSLDEVPLFWKALSSTEVPMSKTASLVARLLLLTGVRKSELLKALWTNVILDGDKPLWHIPAHDRRKNFKAHTVPLSPLAVSLFKELKKEAGDSAFVCATKKQAPSGRLGAQSLAHAFSRLFVEGKDGKPFLTLPGGPVVPHDMRRSARLLGQQCRAKANWFEQEEYVLGHVVGGKVSRHYRIEPDMDRAREIFDAMADLVLQLSTVSKKVTVLPLGRRAPSAQARGA